MDKKNVSNLPVVHKGDLVKATKLELFVQHHELGPVQRETVVYLITEYRTNLPTIERMLGRGISLTQMSEILETRENLSSSFEESVSLIGLHKFIQAFPSVMYDSEVLIDKILEIRETYDPRHGRFLSAILARLVRARDSMAIEDPVYLAEVLANRERVTADEDE